MRKSVCDNGLDVSVTAFPHRNAFNLFHIFPGLADPSSDDELMGWAKEFCDSMAPYSNGGFYVNLLGQDEQARTTKAYINQKSVISGLYS